MLAIKSKNNDKLASGQMIAFLTDQRMTVVLNYNRADTIRCLHDNYIIVQLALPTDYRCGSWLWENGTR